MRNAPVNHSCARSQVVIGWELYCCLAFYDSVSNGFLLADKIMFFLRSNEIAACFIMANSMRNKIIILYNRIHVQAMPASAKYRQSRVSQPAFA